MADTNGRPASEAPSSSSSDFYNNDAPDTQPDVLAAAIPPAADQNGAAASANTQEDGGADDDSSSEMDVSISSREASPEQRHKLEPMPMPEPLTDVAQQPSAKRKLSNTVDVANGALQTSDDPLKKRKLSTPSRPVFHGGVSNPLALPTELWQQIFLYLPPAILCRCLRVCRTFNNCLTNIKGEPTPGRTQPKAKGQPRVRMLDSEAIWSHARKNFFPNMPRPLARCTELEMLKLIGGKTCQFCERPPAPSPATTPFNSGPGPDGLRVFWPLGVRACGRCIETHTLKDVQILVSAAAPLRFGLPYSFLTPDLHFVPEIQRQLPGGIPSHLRVSKVYYSDDIQAIVEEFEDAKTLGQGAAEEWKKGLVNKGKEAMADAARWEKWEGQLRLGTDLSQALREYDRSSFPHHVEEVQSRSAGPIITQPAMAVNGAHPLPQLVHTFQQNGYGTPFQAPGLPFQQPYRPARNPQEVEEARQARRADIERRCKDLEPPLDPSVLQHIESFQAAMQITTPMTDAAWEVLKPRILAQREAAELAEHQRATQLAALQAAIPTNVHDEPYTKPAKEVYDKEYEHAQEPLRSKLGEYADDFINSQWNGGHMLDKDNSPMFAVQTMLHVRQRYFEDDEAGLVPPAEHTTRGGLIQGSPIPEAFLSLDNMKWVYDNKIRPHTDNHRRELFICAGCAEERKPKWFAFEGLIQHYGAKHTTAFSKGNIVVHWQTAEWPEHPPFHPNPSNWIKIDRRTSDYKDHGRARNTPQATHDGPFATPGSGKLLSENPFFSNHTQQSSPTSNGYYSAAQSYPTHHYYGAPSPHTVAYGYPYQPPVPAEPAVDMSYDTQINKLSSDAREIWDSLDGVKQLLECVRIQAMLHHVVTRFLERFRQNPNLDLVTDALATHTLVRPIKNAHGLACKLCVAGQTDGSADYKSYYARIRNVKLYNVSSLITHFKIVHQPQEQSGYFDWTKDMIELPETQLISDLTRAPGMDDDKLAIVAAAFPKAFETPLPKIGLVQEPPAEVGPESGLAGRLLDRMNKKPKQGQKKKGQHGANGTPAREESQEPMPEPKEDEYDPRRPMYLRTEEQASDPARFDTDVARRTSASTPSLSAGAFNLAPETLAALNNLNALTSQTQQPAMYERGDRSPSVGRAEPQAAPQKPTDGSANVQPPDITAILASLTGQPRPAQTATPPISVSARSGSAPRNLHADPYGQPQHASPRSRHEERPSSSRYAQQPAYRNSTEPQTRYDAQDLQAALTRNTRQFEHNQAKTYVEPTYAPPQRSPPRYWYVYDDGQIYSQAPQQPPVYHGHEAPVQYIQLPPDRAPPQPQPIYHQYEQRVAPKPVYVDEYGRPIELIPIDSAPAPVQYVPHPFEQQQQQQYARRPEGHVAYASAVPPPAQHLQPAYEDRRVYFEPAGPAPGGVGQRFVYDDGARSSVPRG